jgi:hypothetical protein
MSRRDDLYKDFIAAATQAYGKATVSNEPNIQEPVALYAMISRMRVQSLPQTVACAERIMRATIDTHFAPGKTIGELHELVRSRSVSICSRTSARLAREELRVFMPLDVSAHRKWILEQALARLRAGGADHVDEGA